MPLFINNRLSTVRMRFWMKLVLLFCFLTVVYQYSQCSILSKLVESDQHSLNLPYSQILKGTLIVIAKSSSHFSDRTTIC